MKTLANQICAAFGNKKVQLAAERQVIELSARKDLLSKIAGCGPVPPGAPREGSGGKYH
jgi:hypothetical protein